VPDKKDRWRKHLYQLRHNTHGNPYLQNAFNKYGEKSFIYEIIDSATSITELNTLEKYYIQQFKSLDRQFGYNLRSGGDSNLMSEETKIRMRNAQNTPELLHIRSKTHKGVAKSKEHIEKIRQSNLKSKNKSPINRYDSTGQYVDQFSSLQECLRSLKIGESPVLRSLKTGYPTFGYYFRREGDNRAFKPNPTPKFYRKINQFTLNGEFIQSFNTIKEAAITLGLQSSAICNCCKGKLNKTGDYTFKYL